MTLPKEREREREEGGREVKINVFFFICCSSLFVLFVVSDMEF